MDKTIIEWDPTQGAARQGDCLLIAVDTIPIEAVEAKAEAGQVILAHSETGHHHAIAQRVGVVAYRSDSPLVGWLRVVGEPADLVHHRDHDTHQTVRIPAGTYRVVRQREHTPKGWRQVAD